MGRKPRLHPVKLARAGRARPRLALPLERRLAGGAALGPAKTVDPEAVDRPPHRRLPACLEATTTTLVTRCVVYFPSFSSVFQSYRRKVAYDYLKR